MQTFQQIDQQKFYELISAFRQIQTDFLEIFGVDDIFSNSKIYEIIIANELDHDLIAGHSGSKDAKDAQQGEYEYKHYKETSSNHSWTFNDYTDSTISNLGLAEGVVFAHIDDTITPAVLDWYILVNGKVCSLYLKQRTDDLLARKPKGKPNARRMINISAKQLEEDLKVQKTNILVPKTNGKYSKWLNKLYELNTALEKCTYVDNLLTSNKIWEVLVALKLNHNVNAEQGGREGAHDAFDEVGDVYEYKVSKTYSWQFQDISENVLEKYNDDKAIILAVVDKTAIEVLAIFSAEPEKVVKRLREKLSEKANEYAKQGKEVRRLQVSLSKGDLTIIQASQIYSKPVS
jgi:plasmid maintenance system killer protein